MFKPAAPKQTSYVATLMNRRAQPIAPVRSFVALRPSLASKVTGPAVEMLRPAPDLRATPVVERVGPGRITTPVEQPAAPGAVALRRQAPETVLETHVKPAVAIARETTRHATQPVQPKPTAVQPTRRDREPLSDPEYFVDAPEPSVAAPPQTFEASTQIEHPAARQRRVETSIDWPPQLEAAQRGIVRMEVERAARDRIAADPRAKPSTAQKLEVRVDQVNVRLDAPPPVRPAVSRSAGENTFGDFFFSRSLR